jgi:hypothetical protein
VFSIAHLISNCIKSVLDRNTTVKKEEKMARHSPPPVSDQFEDYDPFYDDGSDELPGPMVREWTLVS